MANRFCLNSPAGSKNRGPAQGPFFPGKPARAFRRTGSVPAPFLKGESIRAPTAENRVESGKRNHFFFFQSAGGKMGRPVCRTYKFRQLRLFFRNKFSRMILPRFPREPLHSALVYGTIKKTISPFYRLAHSCRLLPLKAGFETDKQEAGGRRADSPAGSSRALT